MLSDPIFHSFIHKKKGIGRVGEKRDRGRGSKGTYYFAEVEKGQQSVRETEKQGNKRNEEQRGQEKRRYRETGRKKSER